MCLYDVLQVPNHVTSISVKIWGSGGGLGRNKVSGYHRGTGGCGGYVSASIPVTPGKTYSIFVGDGGQEGADSAADGGRRLVSLRHSGSSVRSLCCRVVHH